MTIKEFVALVPGFAGLQHPDKILHFGWYLRTAARSALIKRLCAPAIEGSICRSRTIASNSSVW
jgi:hypothetical protein